jgi:non-homologous end joining protein Ku
MPPRLGHIVLSNRERPIIVEPLGLGLRGTTLRYAHEIRGEAEYFADIPRLELPRMVERAEYIVEKMLADFDPARRSISHDTGVDVTREESTGEAKRSRNRSITAKCGEPDGHSPAQLE